MSSWKQHALIEAPVNRVWLVLEDPSRFPDWNGETIAVTGVPTKIEKGSSFEARSRTPLGLKATTTFRVDQFEDMHEIKLRCETSGWYSHWVLTEAQGQTFAELEMGVERVRRVEGRVIGAMHTKRQLRRTAEQALDNLRQTVSAG